MKTMLKWIILVIGGGFLFIVLLVTLSMCTEEKQDIGNFYEVYETIENAGGEIKFKITSKDNEYGAQIGEYRIEIIEHPIDGKQINIVCRQSQYYSSHDTLRWHENGSSVTIDMGDRTSTSAYKIMHQYLNNELNEKLCDIDGKKLFEDKPRSKEHMIESILNLIETLDKYMIDVYNVSIKTSNQE